jgi:hypothetical protein
MNRMLTKWLTFKIFYLHTVLAVFCCIILFELNLMTAYHNIWYDKVAYCWSILLIIHLILLIISHLRKTSKH